ncbi:MAG: hypothetical protein JO360_07265 [Acidobacteria bacterium]|nr:hypothetical protein [Acidobacteriota bacterium]
MNCREQMVADEDELCWNCQALKEDAEVAEEGNAHFVSPVIPQFSSIDNQLAGNNRRQRKFLLVAMSCLCLLLLREGGFFNWYWFTMSAQANSNVSVNGSRNVTEENKVTQSETSKSAQTDNKMDFRSYGFSINPGSDSALIVNLENEVAEGLKREPSLQLHLDQFNADGVYWLPLFKSGTCIYRVSVKAVGEDSTVYEGVLNGEIKFSFTGICSARQLKEVIGQDIVKEIVRSVKFGLR